MKFPFSTQLLSFTLGTALLLSSCSKDDEAVQPTTDDSQDLKEVQLSLTDDAELSTVAVPEAMQQSDDSYAKMATQYVSAVNQIESFTSYFKPPTGATQSSEPITSSNARMMASKKAYLVYTWTTGNTTIAYQLSEEGDNYVWEIFWKEGDGDYLKYVHAEESKTVKKGFMEVYNIFQSTDDILYKYEWEKLESGTLTLTSTVPQANLVYTVSVNSDGSGSVKYISQEKLLYKMEWTREGNGTWAYYSDGEEIDNGSWKV